MKPKYETIQIYIMWRAAAEEIGISEKHYRRGMPFIVPICIHYWSLSEASAQMYSFIEFLRPN